MKKIQIIMEYQVGDGFTYSCTETTPILYESTEAALVDLTKIAEEAEQVWRAAYSAEDQAAMIKCRTFEFAGNVFDVGTFHEDCVFYAPEFYTVDEWFKVHGATN